MVRLLCLVAALVLLTACGNAGGGSGAPTPDAPRLQPADAFAQFRTEFARRQAEAASERNDRVQATAAAEERCKNDLLREYLSGNLPRATYERKLGNCGRTWLIPRTPSGGTAPEGSPACSLSATTYTGGGVWACGIWRFDEQTGRVWPAP